MPHDKKKRAELLSSNPEIFNGNFRKPMVINDISKTIGVADNIKSVKINREKKA